MLRTSSSTFRYHRSVSALLWLLLSFLQAILCSTFRLPLFAFDYERAARSSGSTRTHRLQPNFCYSLFSLPREAELTFTASSSSYRRDESSVPTRSAAKIISRELKLCDVPAVVNLCMEEYGPRCTPKDSYAIQNRLWDHDSIMSLWDQWAFKTLVAEGFRQRIHRNDHSIVCLESINDDNDNEILAVAEVSLQPPYHTATALPQPYILKRVLALWGHFYRKSFLGLSLPFRINDSLLQPYISNVLVRENERGKGYGTWITTVAEMKARSMGYSTVTLHVDANPSSAKVAQAMYSNLGYQPIFWTSPNVQPILEGGGDMENVGVSSAVYFIEGIPLLYLYKNISESKNFKPCQHHLPLTSRFE